MSQESDAKKRINELLDQGCNDKQEIYTKIVEELGIPRPTVRRIVKTMRNEMLSKVKILQSDFPEVKVE